MKRIRDTNGQAKGSVTLAGLEKAPTGIRGLDEISGGGLPRGRTTIVCGGPGCGKTMLGMEFLIRGVEEYGEPGVLLAFEETPEEMTRNVASLGFDLKALSEKKKLFLDFMRIEPSEIHETGDYDLEGLFIRLQHAVDSMGAKRVVLDTLEALFSGFSNMAILRAELRRLFRWLKDRNLTTVVTAEQGEGTLTRHGLEEYVSDCVILLDHRIQDQISTRRLRIVKYRGTKHGADEYPFLIDESGLSVLPVTAATLNHKISRERVSTGIPDLDAMMEGKGYYRGSSILVSGTAGSGKTTLACHFADATCRRGERCLYVGFEESTDQVFRNAASVGIDLHRYVKKGLLFHQAWRPTQYGMEMHLLRIHKLIETVKPESVVMDPISNLIGTSTQRDVQLHADAPDRFPEGKGHHGADDNPNQGRQSSGRHGRTDFVADRYVDTGAGRGAKRREKPLPVHFEIARHGAFQSAARIHDHESGHQAAGALYRVRASVHGFGAAGAGSQGFGRGAAAKADHRAQAR